MVVTFNITEGKKVFIKTISFQGLKAFKEKQLKGIMETNEKDFLSWVTSSGLYKKELLEKDVEKISAFYYNRGYLKAKVGDPEVKHEGDWLYITIPLEEGVQFKMGEVDIQGDLLQPKEKMIAALGIKKEKFYNREVIRQDILQMADQYSLEGFAFAEIAPQVKEDPTVPKVDLVYDIKKGPKVYFERIDIAGNTKTRDKVIRREFKVAEQGLFDATALRRSNENLNRLDYFEEINISTTPGQPGGPDEPQGGGEGKDDRLLFGGGGVQRRGPIYRDGVDRPAESFRPGTAVEFGCLSELEHQSLQPEFYRALVV